MRAWCALLLLCAGSAAAADLYQCKGADGVVAFQNEPCAGAQKTLAHGTYQRQPDAPSIVDPYVSPPPLPRALPRSTNAGAQTSSVSPAPVAYRCTAGQRTWVQYSRCPATYMRSVPVDVDGYTDSGAYISGASGTAEIEAPVQQQALDRNQFCAQLGDGGPSIQHSGQSDVYERNVAKRKYCGQ